MTTQWESKEVAKATNGQCSGQWVATSVSIDTRSIESGALYVALKGANMDGHHFVREALAKGAVAAVVSAPIDGVDAAQLVMVNDTEIALQNLGIAARSRSAAKYIGVTGSVGKTGCKEMLAAALSAIGKTHATKGNLNNHLGVPLSLVNMPLDAQYVVLEMGMNHPGEIAKLSHWAKPDVSIITTVDAVHIEFFENGVEGIADEKATIFDGMGGKGTAILNADNAHYDRLSAYAVKQDLDRIISFGSGDNALSRMLSYQIEDMHSIVEATIAGTHISYRIGTIGKHWALMSVAVLSAVDALGADLAKSAAALAVFSEPKGRGQIRKLSVKGGHLRLIDDAYNASPIAVKGAIEKVSELRAASKEPLRTVVVLGDMLELGEHSRDLHVGLAPTLVNNQIDLVFAAGAFMRHLFEALPEQMKGAYEANSVALAPKVVSALQARDLVLVKGSRGSRMDVVVDAIEKIGE
ncbi:MAG: UDP-N-acetylmuramoyl-tripeptide--D-alanyl-D-alanine ligase [Alphaproteobacteria bacterium]|nr:UDP-N-acetylmuramoyl-tripeptide--D-alanyl-D-alanine ligase [Alphaproteobacteria bacterium]